MAPIRHTTTWNKTVYKMYLFVLFSIIDLLVLALGEFFIILVSCPVYTATPITHSVFRSELPLKSIWSALIGWTSPFLVYILPSNLYKNSLGPSQSIKLLLKAFSASCSYGANFNTSLSAYLCLRFVSPSRFLVSTKQIPFGREL